MPYRSDARIRNAERRRHEIRKADRASDPVFSVVGCDDGTPAQRLIVKHVRYAQKLVREIAAKVPDADVEDMDGYAMLGLCRAAEKFDESRGISFAAFATKYIRGAVLDSFRTDERQAGHTEHGGDMQLSATDNKSADPGSEAAARDEVSFVRAHLGRRSYERAGVHRLTGNAIAAALGITKRGASDRISAARRILDEMDRTPEQCADLN